MRIRFSILIFILLVSACKKLTAQQQGEYVVGYIIGNDTVIQRVVPEIWIYPERKFANKRQQQNYSRYVAKVKKVYPLAVEARILLDKYEPQYYALPDKRDRRKMMKNIEKELLDKHKEELKKWSISDGKILLKLINRETNRSAYTIIESFRGEFSAVFWQGVARLFKNNLKDGYDPQGDDRMLEEVVRKIESGYY